MSDNTAASDDSEWSAHIKHEEGIINPKIESIINPKIEEGIIIKKEEAAEDYNTYNYAVKQKKRPGRKKKPARVKPIVGVKNVVKNYGKAMCSFACSEIAKPYLSPILKEEKAKKDKFITWVQNNKENVDNIESLRSALLSSENDSTEIAGYKRSFQKISLIFLKYFCINWIFSGKLTHTQTHLMFWHKMLRRVKNPELFFYLQHPPKRK
jgi:hypothetical protein